MAPHQVIAGGAGATPTLEQVLAVVHGAQVVLDNAASQRLKKESPAPKAFQPEQPPQAAASTTCSLDRAQARAAIFYKLLSLVNGRSGVRLSVAEAVAALLNAGITPALPAADSDTPALAALASFLQGVGGTVGADGTAAQPAADALAAAGIEAPGLSTAERAAVQDAQSASAGTAALCVQGGKLLLAAANAVAALSAEALQADVSRVSCCFWHSDHAVLSRHGTQPPALCSAQRKGHLLTCGMWAGSAGRMSERLHITCHPTHKTMQPRM